MALAQLDIRGGQAGNLTHYLTPHPEVHSKERLSDLSTDPQHMDRSVGETLHQQGQHTKKHDHEGKHDELDFTEITLLLEALFRKQKASHSWGRNLQYVYLRKGLCSNTMKKSYASTPRKEKGRETDRNRNATEEDVSA